MQIGNFVVKKPNWAMNSRKYLLTLAFLMFLEIFALAKSSWAANYYIDYQLGDDSNTGTQTSSPWKHCPGDSNAINTAASTALKPGDTVYFKKGVTYIGQIATNSGGSEVDYGTNGTINAGGAFSSLGQNFLTTVTAGNWIYIYNNSSTGAYNSSTGFFQIASVDSDTELTLTGYTGKAYATAELPYRIWKPISYTSTSWGTGEAVISGNSTYNYAFRVQNSYLLISNLKFIDGQWPAGYPGPSCTVPVGGTIWDNSGAITGLVVSGCTFDNWWVASYVQPSETGYFVLKDNTLNAIGSLGLVGSNYSLMENNKITDTGSAIRGAGKYSIVRFNTITDCAHSSATYCGVHSDGIGPLFSSSSDPGGNQYGWIYGNYIANTVMGIFLEYNNRGTSNWTIHSNVLVGYYGAGGSGSGAISITSAPNTKIYNNTIFGINGSSGWASGINISHREGYSIPSSSCEIINNIMYSTNTNAPGVGVDNIDFASGLISDYNWFYLPNRATPFSYGGVPFKNFSQWQALGFDTNSFNGMDPNFVDANGSTYDQIDLRLAENSGPRDKGESILTVDRDLNKTARPQGSAWDIGAYEYVQGGDTTPPAAPTGLSVR